MYRFCYMLLIPAPSDSCLSSPTRPEQNQLTMELGKGAERNSPRLKCHRPPLISLMFRSLLQINSSQFVVGLWSMYRVRKWLFLIVLSNFITAFWEKDLACFSFSHSCNPALPTFLPSGSYGDAVYIHPYLFPVYPSQCCFHFMQSIETLLCIGSFTAVQIYI